VDKQTFEFCLSTAFVSSSTLFGSRCGLSSLLTHFSRLRHLTVTMTSPLYHADTTNIGLDEQHEHDSRITSSDGGGSDHEAFQSENLWDPSSWPDFQLDLPLDHPLPWQQIPEYDNDFLNDFGPLDASAPLSVAFDQPFKQHDHQSLRPQSGDYNEQPHVDSIDASNYHPSGCGEYSGSIRGSHRNLD
jgi:hypothetical protein